MPAEVFVVTLRAEKHGVPAVIRLRAALKRLFRDYSLRYVAIRPAIGPPETLEPGTVPEPEKEPAHALQSAVP
jgi:hypothetical protein